MFHQAIACLYAITKTLWSWTVAGQNHGTLASRLEAAEKRLAETTHPCELAKRRLCEGVPAGNEYKQFLAAKALMCSDQSDDAVTR